MKETTNETARRFNRMQWRMLFATMIGYTLFYFMRKNFSFAMPGLQQDCGISKSMLGNFLFWGGIVYGLSKFLNGIVGDKVTPRGGGALSGRILSVRTAGADGRHGDQHLDQALRRHVHWLHFPLLLRRGVRRGQGLRQPCAVVWRLESSAARHGRDCRCRRGRVSLPLVRPRQRLCDFRHKPRKRCVIHRRAGELTRTPLPKFFYQLFQETCHLYKQTLKLLYCPPRAGGRRQPSRGWWTSCTTS